MKSSRIFKPWLILPPKVLAALLMLLALVAVAAGVYTGFFATKGFESTTATIARIEEEGLMEQIIADADALSDQALE